jgi:hypothetical protein
MRSPTLWKKESSQGERRKKMIDVTKKGILRSAPEILG